MTESPPAPTPLAPFILRNFIIPLFIFTDKSLLILTHKVKPFKIIRYVIVKAFLFFLNIIISFIPSTFNSSSSFESDSDYDSGSSLEGDTCIARALYQLLAIVNEIPVSSRKYEVVRSYAEKVIDENLEVGYEPLRRVNATILSGAFSRAIGQLEVAAGDEDGANSGVDVVKKSSGRYLKLVWTRFMKGKTRFGGSAEKLAAELLWLAQKLAACGSADKAVHQWASASKLASLSLSVPQRLQGSLVKLSVFLFKQAANMGGEDNEEGTMKELRKIKMKMLMSWLPFLCRSSIGVDAPILSLNEKTELENVLGELIGSLKHEEEQEKVLSLWLHHFTHCLSSDWPNLHLYYDRWCTTSRKLLILDGKCK
ncbi:hypothetical protein L1987_70913 [Smallanthus sonchifolius]|uniref:Uncharacterized protein n=1 Tax=Smallanthus sonchifolius TaxID=185202 RepID=A0ACB9ART9_9ASTR|nr:hypothetical protein L1987_70913 [Smallanthus sonchifolius]